MKKTKQPIVYTREIDDMCMFVEPVYIHYIKDLKRYEDIVNKCKSVYKTSLPTKESLVYAYMILYSGTESLITPQIEDMIKAFRYVRRDLLEDAYSEFFWTEFDISLESWMKPILKDNEYDINKVVFLDYILRHPELLVAMNELNELERDIFHR